LAADICSEVNHFDSVLAGVLGDIERPVGLAGDIFGSAVRVILPHADADRQRYLMLIPENGCP